MCDSSENLYQAGISPKQLAENVLYDAFGNKMPSIPIDPFELMKDYGIIYQFMEFDELEGIYIVPQDKNDITVVGINYRCPITRQRYTAAHELCHHIKDRCTKVCHTNSRDAVEVYAENFAAELLMPEEIFLEVASKYANNGKVSLDDALLISEYFGVSFSSCVFRLANRFNMLEGGPSDIKKRSTKYKPDHKKQELGIDTENIYLLRQAVDSYPFSFNMGDDIIWHRFKEDFIYNENRMEGINIGMEEVSTIVTDLRLHGQDSVYCREDYDEIIQIVGHSYIYDYIFSTEDKLSIYKLIDLHKMLYKYASFSEETGGTRQNNNFVVDAKFETADWHDIAIEMYYLQDPVEELIKNVSKLSVSEYLLRACKIHHRITQIHPFQDGNGRCSRAFLNWMLRIKGLPPIYIKNNNKKEYYDALALADKDGEYKELLRVMIKELFRTMITIEKATPWDTAILTS